MEYEIFLGINSLGIFLIFAIMFYHMIGKYLCSYFQVFKIRN